jgi:hypothetical protein
MDMKGQYSGRLFILGSGPSLNLLTDEELDRLSREHTFSGSRFFKWGRLSPSFYLVSEQGQLDNWDQRGFENVSAGIAKFSVTWQPPHPGWLGVPRPPALSFHHYTYPETMLSSFEGECNHIHMAHDVPLAIVQVARYLGFDEFALIGCETKGLEYAWPGERRAAGERTSTMLPMYAKASREVKLYDCTPNGALHEVLEYRPLMEVLDDVLVGA